MVKLRNPHGPSTFVHLGVRYTTDERNEVEVPDSVAPIALQRYGLVIAPKPKEGGRRGRPARN